MTPFYVLPFLPIPTCAVVRWGVLCWLLLSEGQPHIDEAGSHIPARGAARIDDDRGGLHVRFSVATKK